MAYKRSTTRYRRGNRGRKTSWYNKKYSTMQLAVKAWRGVKYIKGLVNSELLTHDVAFSGATVVETGSNTLLNGVAQGDTATTRTGNSLLMKSLRYRLWLVKDPDASTGSLIRVIFFFDKQQVADTAPAVSDLLEGATFISQYNPLTKGRFQILSDKTHNLTTPDGGRAQCVIGGTFRFQKHAVYNGTAGTDIQKNGLYVMFIGSDLTTFYTTVTGDLRLSYHDN